MEVTVLNASFRWRRKTNDWQAIASSVDAGARYIIAQLIPRRPRRTGDDVRQSLTKGNGTMKPGDFVPLFLGGIALIAGAPR